MKLTKKQATQNKRIFQGKVIQGKKMLILISMLTSNKCMKLINPLAHWSIWNSLYCPPYISYDVSSENLVLDQLIILKLIFF